MECKNCSQPFRQDKPWQKFCTRKCHDDWHNLEKKKTAVATAEEARARRLNGHANAESVKRPLDLAALGFIPPKPEVPVEPPIKRRALR
jgi:hypothetical protein